MQPYAEIQDPRLQEWYDDYLNVRQQVESRL